MHHTLALLASLASLGLIAAIYTCNNLSHPTSRLRSEVFVTTLVALFTGMFVIALASAVVGVWQVAMNGWSWTALAAGGADVISLVALVATLLVFRMVVRAPQHTDAKPDNITPLTPRPANATGQPVRHKRAA